MIPEQQVVVVPAPQVIEYTNEIPPEFTRTSFADLYDAPAKQACASEIRPAPVVELMTLDWS